MNRNVIRIELNQVRVFSILLNRFELKNNWDKNVCLNSVRVVYLSSLVEAKNNQDKNVFLSSVHVVYQSSSTDSWVQTV